MNLLIEALANGIKDAGCRFYSNYPGFHANELHEALGCKFTSIDEKSAFAYAWGASMAGKRAAVSFKNVGLNDAADAFLGSMFVGCRAGLVLFLFDDCDIQHSQNRFDVRPYFLIHGGLWLEPRTIPEAYEFAKKAFVYSERFSLPVVVRVTNILYEQGRRFVSYARSKEEARVFPKLERENCSSRYVVHPSEAWRMEKELEEKNKQIEEFVEELYNPLPDVVSNEIIFGAKRNLIARNAIRLFTLPLPKKIVQSFCEKNYGNDIVVYEHGATPFISNLVNALLSPSKTISKKMPSDAFLKPKYHNNDYMEKLFKPMRDNFGLICGDLGGYTMDPFRTLNLCLCYGVAPAVAMGCADADTENIGLVCCVIGDGAYLHSGQQYLFEMVERGVSTTIFVLENGGTKGTGGQHIPGNLYQYPQGTRFYELDYASTSSEEIDKFLKNLPSEGVKLVLVHTGEE